MAYVILDGFDLGIGILFPLIEKGEERDTAMNTVAPIWDGNETWLVLGGGGLFAAFPLAYAVLMPAVYAPITAMLLGLVFRGVAFEYRWRDKAHEKYWDASFFVGSIVASFAQGVILGTLVQGAWFDWVTPFTILTGVSLVAGYALLGATWLIVKTEKELQARAFRFAKPMALTVLALIAIVSLCTPLLSPLIADRWFKLPDMVILLPVPLLTIGSGWMLLKSIKAKHETRPFQYSLLLFLFCFFGLAISLYPYAVPRAFTIWEAAAPDTSLSFMLAGALVLLPIIFAYTAYAYWVFRGKVKAGAGYHT
ncbi:UNVERIFIED_CONTAM: hypothetical protein GTU68_006088 [Idotea baltica]|nr:hypothetical protein [Idotea baltica]